MRDWLTHLPWVTRQSWRPPNLPIYRGLDFYPSARFTVPPRVIICHSTETVGFPGYNNGAAAPHFTIDLVSGAVRQHVPLSWGSRCLAVSSGGIRDNTVNVTGTVQIEAIGAVTPGYPRTYGHYDLPGRYPTDQRAQAHLARLWRAIHDETGIPLQMSDYATWVPYPASYGARARQRLSSAQFRDARGLLGHQHAPANDHGDGVYGRVINGRAVDMEATLAIARRGAEDPKPAPDDPQPDPNHGFDPSHLAHVRKLLAELGYTGTVWEMTRAYQTDHNLDPVDGLPGPQTTTQLEDTMSKIDALTAKVDDLRKHVTERTSIPLSDRAADLTGNKRGRRLSLGQAVNLDLVLGAEGWVTARQAAAHGAALEAALESLAGQTSGVDVEAVKAAARAGAEAALQEVRFDVAAASATRLDQEN